jgi:hypothetical protein
MRIKQIKLQRPNDSSKRRYPMYHNTYVAEQVATRDRIERERASEQATMAEQLLQQSAEPLDGRVVLRSVWALLRNNWLLGAQTMLNAISSPSSRRH